MRLVNDQRHLLVLAAAFCLLSAAYSIAVPLFEAPDELWHFSFIRFLATERALPVQPTEGKDMWLREAGQPPLYYLLNAPLVALLDTADFPGFVRFNVAHPAITAGSSGESPNVFIHTPHERFPYRGAVRAIHLVRLLTALWGVGTLLGADLLAREIAPERPALALAATALTAFNPHFIYISSVVNNDACAACLSTLTLWAAARLARGRGRGVRAGVFLGLALLSKVSALALLPLVGLALVLRWERTRDLRESLRRGVVVFGLAVLIAGWWYARNWLLYGDPLAWRVWLIDIGVRPIGTAELLRQFGHVATSFWQPYDGLFPPPVFWAIGAATILAAAGWLKGIARAPRFDRVRAAGLLLSSVWFVLLFVSLVRYMTTTPSAEGRLLFPGLAAFALLMALGLAEICPLQWRRVGWGALTGGLLALSVAAPFRIAARYALPLLDSAEDVAGVVIPDAPPLGGVRLLAVDAAPPVAAPGERVDVTLYWETLSPPPANLRAVVQLWTLGGRPAGQRDAPPAGEIYPPDLWRAGDVLRDVHPLNLRRDAPAPGVCRVIVRLMDGDAPLGEVVSPPLLKLSGAPPKPPEVALAQMYTLDNRAALVGYSLIEGSGALTVTLHWRVLEGMSEDYQIFVHLLDESGARIGQGDGPPLGGDYPTSYWTPGETLADAHVIPLSDAPPLGARLLVGMYRLSDGARLPAYAASGERPPDDAIPLPLP